MEKSEPSIQRSYLEINPLHINPNSTNDQLICNNPGAPAKLHAPVVAGTNITAYWGPWTHAQGPLLVWMARCPSYGCSHFIPRGHDWFKIEQRGLMEGAVWDGLWGMLEMHNNNNSWTTTIPARLESGHYLIRHELVALHIPNTPEFYIQ